MKWRVYMRSFSCVAMAMAMIFSCAAAHADNGTILFTRPVNGTYNGAPAQVGSGLFLMHDNGTGFRQLTPLAAGSYYFPSGVAFYGQGVQQGTWLTKNFSPNGYYIQYFAAQSSTPSPGGPYAGKYYLQDLLTGRVYRLFPGTNDNAAPGYGYLAWGPAGTNDIAFTNSTSELPTSPPCVELMHPDGTDRRTLWCAPATITVTQGPVPSLAVSELRWSGNGKSLLAYVSYQPVPLAAPRTQAVAPTMGGTGFAALFVINVQTGASRLIAPDVPDPAFGDISYDGNVVLYQQQDGFACGDNNPEALGESLCVINLTTGTVTSVFPVNSGQWLLEGGNGGWWSSYWYPQALLSPDGSKVAVTMEAQNSAVGQGDLYIVNTDGSGTSRRLTTRPANAPATEDIAWIPVAWSPDGYQLLTNHVTLTEDSSKNLIKSSEVHIIALSNGRDWDVTHGYAVDWLKQAGP
jgi:hypothetical protein